MSNTLFITGASGFVGGAIARAFANDYRVLAMSRSQTSDGLIASLGAHPVRAELGTLSPDALQNADVVIHCAAFVKQWGSREQFWQANVEGTRQLLAVAQAAGVRRFIHIGTEAALFRGQNMVGIDETYPYPPSTPFLYSETKAAAEQLVLSANRPDFVTLSLRPRFVWGPGDQTVLPAIVAMVNAGRFLWIDGGRAKTSTTHIANLVHGVRLALSRGRGGQAYFIVDDGITTYREFIAAQLATRGVTAPDKSLPGAVARGAATVVEAAWRILGRTAEPPLTRFAAAMMSAECTIDGSKAHRELGYEPVVSRPEGLRQLREFR